MQLHPEKKKGGEESEDSDEELIQQDGTLNEAKHKEMLKDLKKKGQFSSKKMTKREKKNLKAKVRRRERAKEDSDEDKIPTKKEMYKMKKKAGHGKAKHKRQYEQALKIV